jgi:hypothetical protein
VFTNTPDTRYLIDKLGLNGTGFIGGQNPLIAAAMHTTPEDYDRILSSYLSYELLPKEVSGSMSESESESASDYECECECESESEYE